MFKVNLYNFQEKAEENLLNACSEHHELVLSAPTGAWKTVIASKFIDDYLDENPNTVFLWTCPWAWKLEEQSKNSFSEVTEWITFWDVYSFIREENPSWKVYFINWEKINKKSNVVLRETEYNNLMEKVLACHNDKIDIFIIVDEEHKNRENANEFIANIQPKHVLRISATPMTNAEYNEIIDDDDVIASWVIAAGISINENVSKDVDENNNVEEDYDLRLLHLADIKRKEIQKEYDKLWLNIRPLVIIQFPSGKPEWIERVKKELSEMWYWEDSWLVTSWFSWDHPDSPEELRKLDWSYSFLLFKQAIATWWDCPRAKILVKLREWWTEAFNIQTIGRIRRMPERKHYRNDILDNCYIYTLDSKFKDGLTTTLTDSFYTALYKRKNNIPQFTLKKSYIEWADKKLPPNTKYIIELVRDRMLEECDLDWNWELDREEMEESKWYVFGTLLKVEAIEGTARTTKDIFTLNKRFEVEHEINTHDDWFIIRDAKRRIARAIWIDEQNSNNVLRILFWPEEPDSLLSHEDYIYEHNNKLLKWLSLREFNAFLVNNRDRLIEVFNKIDKEEIVELEEVPFLESDWYIPEEQYYKFHRREVKNRDMRKNVFEEYWDNILKKPNRSVSEIEFEKRCEVSPNIKWIYKNWDKWEQYFSIIYRTAFNRFNFYPDYIIQTNNWEIRIIEAKWWTDNEWNSANVDIHAKNKLEALKNYCEENPNIKFWFVRYDSFLYVSNTEWDEDIHNKEVWKPIEDVF